MASRTLFIRVQFDSDVDVAWYVLVLRLLSLRFMISRQMPTATDSPMKAIQIHMCSQFGQPKYDNVGTDASPRDERLGPDVSCAYTYARGDRSLLIVFNYS
jgi:hypothetical protein